VVAWAAGAQLVALNYQTNDFSMLINMSFFEMNGGIKCGYVLKTGIFLGKELGELGASDPKPKMERMSVTIISAQQVPKKA
jgi:phosphatidylinositol phospholipase C delta